MTHQRLNQAEAIQAYDFLQGLGLLGMLIMNAQTDPLVGVLRPQPGYALPLAVADSDTPIQFFLHLLVNGTLCGLFGVGLGWGFYRRWQTDQQAGLAAGRIARRRLGALLGLGLLHGLVVGSGDLLHLYALLGFSLLYFVHQSVPTLLRWIAGLAGFVVLIQLTQFLVVPLSPPALEPSVGGLISPLVNPWQPGSFWEVLRWQVAGLLRLHTRATGQGGAPYVHLEIMLLAGLLIGKLGQLDRPAERRVRLSLLVVLLLPLAILLKGLSSLWVVELPRLPTRWQAYQPLVLSVCDFLGTPLLTGVYLLEMGLNRRPIPPRVAVWMGQLGRMSLTNYLLQSGLSRLLFDEDGLGLSGKLSLLASVGVVLVVYSLQLGFSHWWLRHYPQGPLEQVLSRWSYGKAGARTSAPVSLL